MHSVTVRRNEKMGAEESRGKMEKDKEEKHIRTSR